MINPAVSLTDRWDGSLILNPATPHTSTFELVQVAPWNEHRPPARYIRKWRIQHKCRPVNGFLAWRRPKNGD
jgi:hypothetical protein